MIEHNIDEVRCQRCGTLVGIRNSEIETNGAKILYVDPCCACLEEARCQAYEDGERDGYEEGREEERERGKDE